MVFLRNISVDTVHKGDTDDNDNNIQGVSKRALQIWKRIEIYTEDIHKVLNCQNVAKHTEFYLG
jgi:hypothetical protein